MRGGGRRTRFAHCLVAGGGLLESRLLQPLARNITNRASEGGGEERMPIVDTLPRTNKLRGQNPCRATPRRPRCPIFPSAPGRVRRPVAERAAASVAMKIVAEA